MLKKLSFLLVLTMLATSLICAPAGAEEAQANKAYILSFDDGSYAQVLGGDGSSDRVITDEMSRSEGGKSLCWTRRSGENVTLLFPNKGVENLPGKKRLYISVYGVSSNSSDTLTRVNLTIYNRGGNSIYSKGSYPITLNKWTTVDMAFSSSEISSWSDTAPTAIQITPTNGWFNEGDKLYIDSVWVEYEGSATYTAKNDADSKTVLDFNAITAKGSHDINSNTGITYGYTADTDFDSSNALRFDVKGSNHNNASALFVRCLNSTSDSHYHEQMNWNEYDNVVFRMKALENSGSTVTSGKIYIVFSSGYITRLNDDRSNIAGVDVSFGEWRDYKIPLSQFSNFPDNIRSIVVTTNSTATSDFSILLDSVFLTKDAPETLAAPSISVSGNDVDTYLEGDNTVNFTFAENLAVDNYISAVSVIKNGSASNEAFVTRVNNNVLSVVFADALAPEANYEIILNRDCIKGVSGNVMAENATCSFTTYKAKYAVESVDVVNDAEGVRAVASVSNNTDSRKGSELILAAYKENEFIALTTASLSMDAVSGKDVEASFGEDVDVSGCTFKAFVWDSLEGLTPVAIGK